VHRVLLTELDDPDKFAEFYAIFHADSLLGTGMFAQNTGFKLGLLVWRGQERCKRRPGRDSANRNEVRQAL